MRVISVNVGMPREVDWKGSLVRTAIFKEAVAGPVRIEHLNLRGDEQADLTVHGGPAEAVYAYPAEHYEWWRSELPEMEVAWGAFGENLTTEGLNENELCIGDELRVGAAVLKVTQPRLPCYKLGLRFGRDDVVKKFLQSGRSGIYFSVVETGLVAAGDEIEVVSREPHRVSVADVNRLYLGWTRDRELLGRAVQVRALPEHWKAALEAKART